MFSCHCDVSSGTTANALAAQEFRLSRCGQRRLTVLRSSTDLSIAEWGRGRQTEMPSFPNSILTEVNLLCLGADRNLHPVLLPCARGCQNDGGWHRTSANRGQPSQSHHALDADWLRISLTQIPIGRISNCCRCEAQFSPRSSRSAMPAGWRLIRSLDGRMGAGSGLTAAFFVIVTSAALELLAMVRISPAHRHRFGP